MAAPTTYAVNGEQYVAVQVGYGGTAIAEGPVPPSSAALKFENTNRIIAFKLGGGAVPTPPARVEEPFAKPPEQTASKAGIEAGEVKFVEECSRCHALGINVTPDLRRLNAGLHAEFKDIVLHGVLGAGRHGAIRRHLERAGRREHPRLPDRPELGRVPRAGSGEAPVNRHAPIEYTLEARGHRVRAAARARRAPAG